MAPYYDPIMNLRHFCIAIYRHTPRDFDYTKHALCMAVSLF